MLTINISFLSDVTPILRSKFETLLRVLYRDSYSHFDCPFKIVKVSKSDMFFCIDLSITFSLRFLEDVNKLCAKSDGIYVSSFNYNI